MITLNCFDETKDYYAANWFSGMELAYPEVWKSFHTAANCASLCKRVPTPERVTTIISGGGSDGPLLPAFVGEGLADACIVGAPYSAPNAYAIYETAKELSQRKKEVVFLYNNFSGDYLNNDMAAELLMLEGYSVESIAATDDMGMAVGEAKQNRGGRCGLPYLIKIASHCAISEHGLHKTAQLLRYANERISTLCVTIDQQENVVSYGAGFSGEPGFFIDAYTNLQSMAEKSVGFLIDDISPAADEKLYLLVNRLRFTSYADSYHMAHRFYDILSKRHPIAQMRVGAFSNILDVYGYTFTLLAANREIASHLDGDIMTDCIRI